MEEKQSITAKKSLGQHFLTSDIVPKWLCDAGAVEEGNSVVEIGPGTGVLTEELLLRGARVLALEADERAIEVLAGRFAEEIMRGQLTVLHSDVRTLDIASLPDITCGQYKVIANIPYYLSGMLFRAFLSAECAPSDLVYLVQKEVAKRATGTISKGEKVSLLSLSTQVYGEATYVKTVSRGHFSPPPKVDSGIIAVRNISKDNFKNTNEALFFELLHLGFGQKRKQLLGNLSQKYDRETLIQVFSTADIPENARAETVSLEKWLQLTDLLSPHTTPE